MQLPRPTRGDLVDVSLAAVLGVASVVDVFTHALDGTYPHGAWPHAWFAAISSVPVAWRRRSPLLALIALAIVQSVWIFTLFPPDVQPPFIPFVQLILVVFAAAAYADGRALRAAAVVVAIGILTDIPTLFAGKPLGDVAGPDVFILLSFALGLGYARMRRQGEQDMRALAQAERDQHDLAERAAAAERARIARELHDVISHDVSMIVIQAAVERRMRGTDDETDSVLATIESTGREALSELRRMLGVLHHGPEEDPLRPQPGLDRLDDLVQQARSAGVDVQLVIDGARTSTPPGAGIAAYRIVQESLTNAAKHASGAAVTARVRLTSDAIEVEVIDDGAANISTVAVPTGGGHGLVGMRERVEMFGGTLEAGHRPEGGFRVRAHLPVPS